MLYNQEAEMGVIGAAMVNAEAAQTALATVRGKDFYIPAHRVIFDAMSWLNDKDMGIDLISVRNELRASRTRFGDELEEVGGVEYLVQIADECFVPAMCEQYCRMVKELSDKRAMVETAKEILAKADDSTSDELRAYFETANTVSSSIPKLQHISAFRGKRQGRGVVTTGFDKLDSINVERPGGYPSGQITLVEAYHKAGKTSFKLNSAMRILAKGHRVAFATFADLTGNDVEAKLMRYLCGWSFEPTSSPSLQADFYSSQKYLDDLPLWVYDVAGLDSGCNVETFIAAFKGAHAKEPFDIVFVDYAQEIGTSERCNTRVDEQRKVAEKLRLLAVALDIPVVIGSQITEGREGERDRSKDSRAWEEKAGWVLRLKRQEGTETLVQSPISRFGGNGFETILDYETSRGRFIEVAA